MTNEKLEKVFKDLKKAIEDIEKAGGSIAFELNAVDDVNITGAYYRERTNEIMFY